MTTVKVDHAVRTEGLDKRYGRTWALRDCTLTLPAGRVAALVGPNGAGKTTLMRLLVGLLAPTRGSVEVFGQSPDDQHRDCAVTHWLPCSGTPAVSQL